VTAIGDSTLVEPDTASELAAALRTAAARRHSVLIRGAGTKVDWGRPPGPIAVILSTRRLKRIVAHQHGDLTATVEAGAALADVNQALGRYGQWLPLDPPFSHHATIGGILATNDSGPLRHRHGTPRDLVIGVELATTDGALAKAGGRVVKNVAGYDLSKLVAGSFGSLAAIVTATFKLAPLPTATKTLLVETSSFDVLGALVQTVMASQLEPMAFELHVPDVVGAELGPPSRFGQRRPLRPVLLMRFASAAAAVDAQIAQARALLPSADCGAEVLDSDHERETWQRHARQMWESPGAIVRAGWLPAHVPAVLNELRRLAGSACIELAGRAAAATGLLRIDADVPTQAGVIERLRQSTSVGNVVIVRGRPELKALVDVWGPQGDRERLFASLKQAMDPHGILNAGRGPL
jgi:glycolate dehydrogenase FAD-binding subunit